MDAKLPTVTYDRDAVRELVADLECEHRRRFFVLSAAICPTKPRWTDMPASVTIETAIMTALVGLQALCSTAGADTSSVQPVAVGIEAILNVLIVDRNVV